MVRSKRKTKANLEPGLMIPVDYIRAVDGDTIEVEIRRKFKVRLRDIDIIEKRDPGGKEATEFVDNILLNAKEIKVFIPTNSSLKLLDFYSFERAVGEVYVDELDLSNLLRDKGFEK